MKILEGDLLREETKENCRKFKTRNNTNDILARIKSISSLLFHSRDLRIKHKTKDICLFPLALLSGNYSLVNSEIQLRWKELTLYLTPLGGLILLSIRYFEPVVFDFMRKLSGDVFVDIGANLGGYTIACAPHFNKVIAVEPSSITRRQLIENIKLNNINNVVVEDVAVGLRDGFVRLYHAKNSINWSIKHESSKFDVVKGKRLSEIVDGLDLVELIKIDVEGAEFDVLRSADQNTWSRVKNVVVEVRGVYEREIIDFMSANHFICYILERRPKIDEKNLLFTKVCYDSCYDRLS